MHFSNPRRFHQQVRFLRWQFLQDGDLPFTNVLSEEIVTQALTAAGIRWNKSIYQPLVTLWIFLGQTLSADPSCLAAVARLIAHRCSHGQSACSADTGAYCQARKRLPEKLFSDVACQTGRALDKQIDPEWLWKKRRVYMFDGTTVSMPDTLANQRDYPQVGTQKPGVGFPIARLGSIISLSCGAVVGLGFRRYAGKGQGEVSLLRELWDVLCAGDVLLTDCLLSTWTEMVLLKQRGVDTVSRLNKSNRSADFRRGKSLGKGDHIVRWPKPSRKPLNIDREAFKALPEFLEVRELKLQVKVRGFRTKKIVVVTTLLDPKKYTKSELEKIYRARWNHELDLRSIKITMQMGILRCKTPALVRKEIWTHILAYNLIRTVMAQAAVKHNIEPRTISFKGAIRTLEAFQPHIDCQEHRGSSFREELYGQLLDCIATHRVANRPDRFEPRLRKRRPKHYGYLRKPRKVIKSEMAKGVTKI
jgi:hypothetical protein